MLPLLALTLRVASAGDQALYARALELVDDHYLRPEGLSRTVMLGEAAEQLEARVEWLIADTGAGGVTLRDGQGTWQATVQLEAPDGLAAALARIEDEVRAANLPIPAGLDLRVELLRGALKSLDRHSVVLHADGLERFDERLSGTLSGVGATISLDGDGLFVRDVVVSGPAARGGVRPDDRLVTIDGVSTVGMVPGDATDRIRGAVGTNVTLGLRRVGEPLTLTLRREEITIRNVEASRGPHDVGVITIEHFSEQTRGYLLEALAELEADGLLDNGLVIDLRGNTGGSLIQSAQAADTFLQSGLIVSTTGRNGAPVPSLVPKMDAHPEVPGYTMPIAVLMDHSTASGSEILAGALAGLDRALLVGATSFGKGTVQKIYQLDPSLKLKLTVAEYLLEGGTRVADIGLAPDIALEEVRFDDGGVWYPSPTRERRKLRPGTPILRHTDGDRPLEVAATVVAATAGGTRRELLATARELEAALVAEEDARVTAAFAARGIDWSAAPAPPAGPPVVDVVWSTSTVPTSGQKTTLTATVTNRGPTLHRAALRLESVNRAWDDLVLPLGRVERGASRTGSVEVTLEPGLPTRSDRVAVALELDGAAPYVLRPHDLTVAGAPLPAIAVTARASRGPGGTTLVTLDVDNRSDRLLSGLRARFAFPNLDGVELVDKASEAASVTANGNTRLTLRLRVGTPFTGDTLPLDLTVSGDAWPRLADWHLDLPVRGGAVRLEPPTLTVETPPTVLPPGTTRLRVRASDDRALDHVLVYAGAETVNRVRTQPTLEHAREKVAWRAPTGRRTELDLLVPVTPGTNRYVVIAEDRAGLRTQRDVYVYGDDGGEGVTAPE